ncbi:MAG: type II toxin-antitoxin system VapC family toxin [Acidimicrobiales bacterium]
MLLLDTNVVSEVMRPQPSPSVVAWLAEQLPEHLHLSTITIAEIHFGLALLDDADRRADLVRRFERFVLDGFASRIIVFDQAAAVAYGAIAAGRRRAGHPIAVPDAQIAAIARTQRLTLATRNTRDFGDLELDLLDPFDLQP